MLRPPHICPQWGSLEFHKKSLSNLAEAMRKTRKLCAVVVDTIGRELTVNRPTVDEVDGWPKFDKGISVKAEDKVELPLSTVCQMLLLLFRPFASPLLSVLLGGLVTCKPGWNATLQARLKRAALGNSIKQQ